jgi:DNA-binding winged helix-turn-helix (wHTH) protein
LLSLRKGTPLSKQILLEHLYDGVDEPELRVVDVFILKLRKKIAAATGGQHYIETVWGHGYVLKDPEKELGHSSPSSYPRYSPQTTEPQIVGKMIDVLDRLNEVFLAAKQSSLEMPATVQLPPRREADARNRIFLAQNKEDKQSVRQLYATLKNLGSIHGWMRLTYCPAITGESRSRRPYATLAYSWPAFPATLSPSKVI